MINPTLLSFFAALSILIAQLNICLADTKLKRLRIGVILGLTGPAEIRAKFVRRGIELAAREIEADRKEINRRIEIYFEDSQSTPKGAVTAFKKLTEFNKVEAVIGDVWASMTNPLIPLAESAKVPLISPTVVDRSVERTNSYFYTLGPRMSSVKVAIETFFRINKNVQTLSVVFFDDPWGQAYREELYKVSKQRNVRILDEVAVSNFGSDYRAEIQRVCSKKPAALFISNELDRVARRMDEVRCKPTVLTTTHLAERLYDGSLPYEKAQQWYFIDWPPKLSFVSDFKKQFGELPIDEAQNGYEAIRALHKASVLSPLSLNEGLPKIAYKGVAGGIDFSQGSFANRAEATLMIVDGENIRPAL